MDSTWLQGRTVLVTGATSGIGRSILDLLAPHVKRLLFVGRDAELVQSTATALREASPQLEVEGFTADLSRQADTRNVAEWAATFPELDGLINNVGAVMGKLELTADGIERQFAINYVNQVLLTRLLLPVLARGSNAATPHRIVMVSSLGHRSAKAMSTEFAGRTPYVGLLTYRQSKLAQCFFTAELARRLQGWPLTINAVCPGPTRTHIGSKNANSALARWSWEFLTRFFFHPVEQGAANVVKVLADDSLSDQSGQFYENLQRSRFSAAVGDLEAAKSLWNETCDRLQLPRELEPRP